MKLTKSGLLVPETVTESFKARCRVCGTMFRDMGPQYERHVTRCAEQHAERLHRANPANDPIFSRDSYDRELEDWVDENRTAIREGRKRIGS